MGQVLAGGSSRPVTAEELQSVAAMQQAMPQIPVPTLKHLDNPHEYLFSAMSDGSRQDLDNPSEECRRAIRTGFGLTGYDLRA